MATEMATSGEAVTPSSFLDGNVYEDWAMFTADASHPSSPAGGEWAGEGDAATMTPEMMQSAGAPNASAMSPNAATKPFECHAEGCGGPRFTRLADLQRHMSSVHALQNRAEYRCDYARCGRRDNPFHRRDHFRDHLRVYHHEDLPKRGDSRTSRASAPERHLSASWWRCGRCLERVDIPACGWKCPRCKRHCEADRRAAREKAGLISTPSTPGQAAAEPGAEGKSPPPAESQPAQLSVPWDELAETAWWHKIGQHGESVSMASPDFDTSFLSTLVDCSMKEPLYPLEDSWLNFKVEESERHIKNDPDAPVSEDNRSTISVQLHTAFKKRKLVEGQGIALASFAANKTAQLACNPTARLLACPYYKHDPTKYKSQRSCCGPGWSSVHRVKEHLYRRHRQPRHRCQRCWAVFDTDKGLQRHVRSTVPCSVQRAPDDVDGFDEAQEKLLRSRKKTVCGGDEPEKWKAVYLILFPKVAAEDIPLHHYDIEKPLETSIPGEPSRPEILTEVEEHLRRELPGRLRARLDQELGTLLNLQIQGESVMDKLVNAVLSVQLDTLTALRDPESSPGTEDTLIKEEECVATDEILANLELFDGSQTFEFSQ